MKRVEGFVTWRPKISHLLYYSQKKSKKIAFPTKGKTRVVSLYSVLHAYTLLFMTSNHTQLKQFSFTDSIRTSDSPRFASLPQYTEPTEPKTYYLLRPLLSQPVAKPEFGMRRPKGYLIEVLAAEECGLLQTDSCGANNKYLYFLIN